MKGNHSSHSTYNIGYHIVWCTKFRKPVLTGRVELVAKRLIAQACVAYGQKKK